MPAHRRLAPLLAAAVFAAATPASAATFGLVVGIDDYVGLSNDLFGSVNDAEDIAAALTRSGADQVVLLVNWGATKAAITAEWHRLVAAAVRGDTIVFSYSGHGSQEPEPPGRNGEADGLNETFVLGGYQARGAASAERIVDDEIYEWLKAADDAGIAVIFLADSCHSGSMYRAVSSPLRYRAGDFEPPAAADDTLTLPAPDVALLTEADFDGVTFIGATQEDRLTPEIDIDGVPRGALSWAFARALDGAADLDGDGALSQHELIAYLVPTVEMKAQNQQVPSVLPVSAQTRPILSTGRGAGRAVGVGPVAAARVHVLVEGDAAVPAVAGVEAAADAASADLIWNQAAGTVDHRLGGRVANNVTAARLPAVLSKWAALEFVTARAVVEPVTLSLASGNQTYRRGEQLTLTMEGATRPYLTLFNLPPDGRVELLVPANATEARDDWRGERLIERLVVADPPYGAEHIVAILTDAPATALHAALATMDTADSAAGLAAMLATVLAGQEFQAGVLGIYTAE